MVLVEFPLLVLQALVWLPVALGALVYKTVARKVGTIVAFSQYPTPSRAEERVIGWRASRERARALIAELVAGTATPATGRRI
jgi:hypothetical protein